MQNVCFYWTTDQNSIAFVAVLLKFSSKSRHLCASISAHSLHAFPEAVNDKMLQTFVHSENALRSRLDCRKLSTVFIFYIYIFLFLHHNFRFENTGSEFELSLCTVILKGALDLRSFFSDQFSGYFWYELNFFFSLLNALRDPTQDACMFSSN